jgi:hypothetical protein
MAIEINTRTKILAGVVVLLAAGAGAWFFFLEEFLNPPAPPPAVVAKPAAKAEPGKPGDAAKPAEPAKAPDAAKTADAAKAGAAPKPAAAAKPIPTNPDQLIAEVIETSGLNASFKAIGEEAARDAVGGGRGAAQLPPEARQAIAESMQRIFEPAAMSAEVAAKLKGGLDTERMSRYLEILRQPVVAKMTSQELRKVDSEELAAFNEKIRKEPLPAARVKLIQTIDEVTRNSEVGADLFSAMVNAMLDAVFAELAKSGKAVPPEARRSLATQLNAVRSQARSRIVGLMYYQYRNVSDEDLAAYTKLMDTDTGRWGGQQLVDAARPMLVDRFGAAGKDIAKTVLANRAGAVAKKAPEPAAEPLAKASTTPAPAPAEKPAEAAPAAPPAPVGYQRAANTRDLYTRYNDLITATVMRDQAAVKELLDDGKSPNVRQADGSTPLMIAVGNNDAATAGMLLAKGADPNARAVGGVTALSIARSRGAAGAGMVQLLQRGGAKD